jgi:hypothetical protein
MRIAAELYNDDNCFNMVFDAKEFAMSMRRDPYVNWDYYRLSKCAQYAFNIGRAYGKREERARKRV